MTTDVKEIAVNLRLLAGHFATRDWNYTRNLGSLESLKYKKRDFDKIFARIRRAGSALFEKSPLIGEFGWKMKLAYIWHVLSYKNKHLPDGVLSDGSIITHWEEDGEYINTVQPSVGLLLADWLEAEPNNPHAIKIAQEIERIHNNLYPIKGSLDHE